MQKFNRPYVRNWNRKFTPLYVAGENYSFYINPDKPIDYLESGIFIELWLIKTDNTPVIKVGNMYRLFPDEALSSYVSYHLFIPDFVFPHVPDGEYYFQVIDPAVPKELCRSNIILANSTQDCILNTTLVKYRHNDALYNIRYDLLTDLSVRGLPAEPYYNKFRLPINQIGAPEVRSERTQYRQASNGRELRNSKSFRDIVIKLEFYWADDRDFEALSAMLEHNEIYISGNRVIDMTQVKIEKPTDASKLSKGTFEVIVDTYGLDYRSLEGYGDFILFGGTGSSIYNTFIQG